MPRRNVLILLAVIGVSLLCYEKSSGEHRSRYGRMFATYCQVMQEIEEQFIKEVDPRDLFDAGLNGMMESLDDPHSIYVPPTELKEFNQELRQEFGGIGVNVEWDNQHKTLRVMGPLPGTPAFDAGLMAGDLILEVDAKLLQGLPLDEAVGLIKGKPGTQVRLKVLHEGQTEPQEYAITRAEIKVPAVLGDRYLPSGQPEFMLEGEPGIAYIRLQKFGEKAVEETKTAVEKARAQGMKGLILDLRGNPGGLLEAAVDICDLFVDGGTIVSTRDRKGRKREGDSGVEEFKAHPDGTFTGFPMVVLINGFSASASEIVAACLQDHGRATIVGERSFGKGSVQHIIPLDGGRSALKLTVASYWRPSGKNIHRLPGAKEEDEWGVTPDEGCLIKLDAAARKKMFEHRRQRDVLRPRGQVPALDLNLDPQLKKAVEILKSPPSKAVQT